jgi:hypothetical protein
MNSPKDFEKESAYKHLDADNDTHLEEWKQARDLLKSYDDRLHDLRKYGFSFLTALLTAEAILGPTVIKQGEALVDNANVLKFAVLAVTLLLIAALHLLDRNYRLFQQAADTRAVVLERRLNLELSEVITARYRIGKITTFVFVVYLFFIFGVLLLGGFVLQPDWGYVGGLALFAIITAIIPPLLLKISYSNKNLPEDWSVSPLESTFDDLFRITLTNMKQNLDPIIFREGDEMWRINDEDGQEIFRQNATKDTKVIDSYTWTISPKAFLKGNLVPGVYQLQPRGWPRPLRRRIIVLDKIVS